MPSRSDLERHVSDLAALFGWLHHRTRSPGLTPAGRPDGFPSETLVHGERLLFLFVTPTLTPRQREWLDALRRVEAVEAHVCDPADLPTLTALLRQGVS